jgi:uncharacterized cupin superfamily protein
VSARDDHADRRPGASAVVAGAVAPRQVASTYPAPFAARLGGREKRVLGDLFGLSGFGVNLTRLAPGAMSALRHAHSVQDEFVYILAGEPTLLTDAGEQPLQPGMCVGFRAGSDDAHQLVNRSDAPVEYLEIGDRRGGDAIAYPDDDLALQADADGGGRYTHKDGTPY